MKRAILAGLIFVNITGADLTLPDDLAFDRAWQVYLLKKHGCPTDIKALSEPMGPDRCTNPTELDVTAFLTARKYAKVIFELEDKPHGSAQGH